MEAHCGCPWLAIGAVHAQGANRRKFDIVMAWAIDRLGRSLIDLLDTI